MTYHLSCTSTLFRVLVFCIILYFSFISVAGQISINTVVVWKGGDRQCSPNTTCPTNSTDTTYYVNYASSKDSGWNKGAATFQNTILRDWDLQVNSAKLFVYGHLDCFSTPPAESNVYNLALQGTTVSQLRVPQSVNCSKFEVADNNTAPELCVNCFENYTLTGPQYTDGWPGYNYGDEALNNVTVEIVSPTEGLTIYMSTIALILITAYHPTSTGTSSSSGDVTGTGSSTTTTTMTTTTTGHTTGHESDSDLFLSYGRNQIILAAITCVALGSFCMLFICCLVRRRKLIAINDNYKTGSSIYKRKGEYKTLLSGKWNNDMEQEQARGLLMEAGFVRDSHSRFSGSSPRQDSPVNAGSTKSLNDDEDSDSHHSGSFHRSSELSSSHGSAESGYRDGKSPLVWNINKEIEPSEIKMGTRIGRGSYGDVFAGSWAGTTVAIKRLPASLAHGASKREKEEFFADFMREALIMRSLRHPHVLQLLATYLDPPDLCIVMEFMPRGSLYNVIHNRDLELKWPLLRKILTGASRGMAYLHNSNPVIVHRDLKSHNLLLDESWKCKIGDFGLAKMLGQVTMATMTACGTPCWTAPEVLRNEHYTEKADVYSFGIVLWECITRMDPHSDMPAFQVIFAVGSQGLRPPMPKDCPKKLTELVTLCWDESPEERPTFLEIIELLAKINIPDNHLAKLRGSRSSLRRSSTQEEDTSDEEIYGNTNNAK